MPPSPTDKSSGRRKFRFRKALMTRDPVTLEQAGVLRALPLPTPEVDEPAASLVEILAAQWRLAAAVSTATAFVLVTAVQLTIHPQYLVSATVHVAPVVRPILFQDADTDISRQFSVFIATQAQALVSSSVLSAAVELPAVKAVPSVGGSPDPVTMLKSRIAVEPIRSTELLSVSMIGESASQLVTILNGVLTAYLAGLEEDQRRYDDKVLRSLKKEETDLAAKLAAKTKEIRDHSAQVTSGAADSDTEVAALRFSELQRQLTATNTELVVSRAKLQTLNDPQSAKSALESEGFEAFRNQDPQWLGLVEQIRAIRMEAITAPASGHGPMFPSVRNQPDRYAAVRQELENRQTELRQEFAIALRNRLENKVRDCEVTVKALQDEISVVVSGRADLTQRQLALKDLQEERTRLEQAHMQVRQKIWNVEIEQQRMSRVTIQSPPKATASPNLDRRPKYLAAAFALSLFAGAFAALMRSRLDRSVREPLHVSNRFGLPVLGSIQSLPGANGHGLVRDDRLLESMRVICTALLPTGVAKPARVRLITSPSRGAGKSTVATNLARSLAVSGRKVLFIDADIYGRGASRDLGVTEAPGFREYLEGKLPAEKVVRSGGADNLFIVPAGAKVERFGELLARQASQERIRALFAGYDEVVVDSAPVLASSSAIVLATLVDEIVLVIRAGRSTNEEVQAARRHLSMVGGNIVGAVLNAVDGRGASYLYSYAYETDLTAP